MLLVDAWGEGDGTRKSRKTICAGIEAIFGAVPPDAWFEPEEDAYGKSYPRLKKRCGELTRQRGWTAALVAEFVRNLYSRNDGGWMARASGRVDLDYNAAAELAEALNAFDRSNQAVKKLVDIASRLVNNSMVGASKFLHFCLPGIYAITDQFLRLVSGTPSRGTRDGVSRAEAARISRAEAAYYCTYMAALNQVDRKYAKLAMRWARKVFKYRVTRVRAIEAFVFYHVKEYDYGRFPLLAPVMPKKPRHAEKKAGTSRYCRKR
ncbi:hypothetical protein WJ09_18385 [Burkholderia vietnamiensis]|nr:hypothetical protein WJ09_18385 [Burkholderia vietnamiensis]